ncbi:Glucitol operon repressor [Botrimarina colliarenosi]|uniref:Glucitol operon repressor n=1 Tax=Botrimarina colliarenosi TaxID=2528001 RepID=A0A5C6AGG2_9BACT|nr:DeoR/GlpR family DNA-binding transcription regulator [Botrimarina colliarenosi]TWT98151.1 Glucitol operon repressor [Botrimarina colliarenosi]
MLAGQRQREIVRDLQQQGAVSVAALAERFAVTDETIRRDLTKLARSGRVVRTHGGAVLADEDAGEAPFAVRVAVNTEAKQAIARHAAALVEPGEVIAIDASSTGLELAKLLPHGEPDRPITVVSNGLDVVHWLAERPGVNVISTGGEFDASGQCFVGSIAEAALRQFAFHRAFVSCKAVDASRGAGESCPSHAAVKRAMLAAADEAYLLADSSKAAERAMCYYAEPRKFTRVFSDDALPDATREALVAAGAELVCVAV